jgi:hypothetical protein
MVTQLISEFIDNFIASISHQSLVDTETVIDFCLDLRKELLNVQEGQENSE